MQGPSMGFIGCNQQLQAKVPGGTEYNTVYPAGLMQDSGGGTADVSAQMLAMSVEQSLILILVSSVDCQPCSKLLTTRSQHLLRP